MSTLLATVSRRGQGHRAIDSLPKVSQLLSGQGGIQAKWVWGQRPGAQWEHLPPSHTPYYWSQGGVIPDPGALSQPRSNCGRYVTFLKKRLCCFPLTSSFLGPMSRNATVRNGSWLFLKTKSQSHKQSWSVAITQPRPCPWVVIYSPIKMIAFQIWKGIPAGSETPTTRGALFWAWCPELTWFDSRKWSGQVGPWGGWESGVDREY